MLSDVVGFIIVGIGWIFFFPGLITSRLSNWDPANDVVPRLVVRVIATILAFVLACSISEQSGDLAFAMCAFIMPGIHHFVVRMMLNEEDVY